jgi:CheY-like chemotaxis protein
MTGNINQPLLIIEDSDEDFESFCRIARKLPVHNPIFRCIEGDEVFPFLKGLGPHHFEAAPRPAMILLDLNLPGLDGREVLRRLKQDEDLKEIPVIVWTTSANPKDVEICYKWGANSYLLKPMDIKQLSNTVHALVQFWLDIALLPQRENP